MNELMINDFDYTQLDSDTAEFLKQKETNIKNLLSKYHADLIRAGLSEDEATNKLLDFTRGEIDE